jgi:adenylate cyclase
MAHLPRFRRFGTRLLFFIAGLVALSQAVTYLVVSQANRRNALASIDAALEQGARQFQAAARRQEADLLLAARMMAGDYALRQLFLVPRFSPSTARSALVSYRKRIDAPTIVMLAPDGQFIADTKTLSPAPRHQPFFALREVADLSDEFEAAGWGFLDGNLYQIVIVPMLAPPPEVAAWIGIGFPVDQSTAAALKATSALEITFLAGGEQPRVIASTLPAPLAAELALAARPAASPGPVRLPLGEDAYVTAYRRVQTALGEPVWIVLQRSLEAELAPSRRLEAILAIVTLAGLAAAVVAALLLARSFGQPVRLLAKHTQRISYGDYATRIELRRSDELGDLAEAFNAMSDGLAERDRVRDLLDKNVSPEVAANLLRDGLALGGEEREVTILFADLRGFTTLSEHLAPRELVTLLNRYLDRMSAAIEAEGGVIDKYIGDEIMALFGAPLAAPDSADRAVRAALAMRRALAAFNQELAAENRPPLAFGVGINTARVVAGNIGSHRRLNYSVIGDGVNLAARLQPLTRRAEYAADIIVSEAVLARLTRPYRLRSLGEVTVKGRAAPVAIHAVDDTA